ncbi:MAG: hypothetical protein ACLTR4_02875 [Gallintestinimicrobium sp.]
MENKASYIKKNPAKQDSPPAAGRASDILPFRCSAIRAERLLSYGNEVSYTIKKNVPWHILAPRRGCFSNHLPLRRVRILAERLLSYENEVFYTIIKKGHAAHPEMKSMSFFLFKELYSKKFISLRPVLQLRSS